MTAHSVSAILGLTSYEMYKWEGSVMVELL